jgi:hypothetical protein
LCNNIHTKFHKNWICHSELLIFSITIPGCGGYADDNVGAVSTTGHGESIMKFCLAHTILTFLEQGSRRVNLVYVFFIIYLTVDSKCTEKLPPKQNVPLPGKETRNNTVTQQGSCHRTAGTHEK